MSDTISKSALIEWLSNECEFRDLAVIDGKYAYIKAMSAIQSGRFDTDNSGEWKAISEMAQREKQALYDTLKDAQTYISNGYEYGYIDDREGYTEKILRKIDRALMPLPEPPKGEDTE